MDCSCGLPARNVISRDGRPCYTCAHGRCRFYAVAPVQCEGYNRIFSTSATSPGTVIVRFEALAHPDSDELAVSAVLHAPNEAAARETVETARAVLEADAFSPLYHVTKDAYVYAMGQYSSLVAALRKHAQVLVEELPSFFFRCAEQAARLETSCQQDMSLGTETTVDMTDIVYTQLKDFQRKGLAFAVAHRGRAMIADDMGLGKTVQAIAFAHLYRSEWPLLVVCPMSLVENWAKEINRFCGIPFSRIAILQGTKAQATSVQDVVIVSYSSLKSVDGSTFQVVVLDESHYIKAGESKRTQLALKLARAARRVLLLSGTPAMSRPMELYTQLLAIHPTMVPTKTQYGARYCNAFVSRFGVDYTGHSHIDELHYLLRHFVIRRTKRQLSEAELPSKTRQLLYVYITAKEKKALEKQVIALRHAMDDRGGVSAGGATGTGDFSGRAPNAFELKIATARAKIPAVQDYVSSVVEQHLEMGEKVIFFAHHQCMMEAIREAVEAARPRQPIDYIYITGETSAVQREQLAAHFKSDPTCGVAVLSMGSCGTGHNFTCASTVVFAELDWNPGTHLQCEDRIHRIGQSNACSVKYLLAEGTSDTVIWPLLKAKLSVTSAVLESNRQEVQRNALTENTDRQKVFRRDVSSSDPSTQGTLDGFLRLPSTPQAATAHAACNTSPPLRPNDGATDAEGDEDVVVVGSHNALPCGTTLPSYATSGAHHVSSGTLPSPPSPSNETLTPASQPHSGTAAPAAGGNGGSSPPALCPPRSTAAEHAASVLITVAEMRRRRSLVSLRSQTEQPRSRVSQSSNGSAPASLSGKGGSQVKSSSQGTPGRGRERDETPHLPSVSVLDLLKKQTPSKEDDGVRVVDGPSAAHAATAPRSPEPVGSALRSTTPTGGSVVARTAPPFAQPHDPLARAVSQSLLLFTGVCSPQAAASAPSLAAAAQSQKPRRTVFTLAAPTRAEQGDGPMVTGSAVPQPAVGVPATTPAVHTLARLPIRDALRKRTRSSHGDAKESCEPSEAPDPSLTLIGPPVQPLDTLPCDGPERPPVSSSRRTSFRFGQQAPATK